MRFFFGVFIMMHGLVHLLYAGQSTRYFELKPGMLWPDGSWVFSRLLGNEIARNIAGISLILAAIGLMVGGISLFANQAWWRTAVICATLFSSMVYVFFWDGRMQNLDAQGLIGIFIDVAILLAVLIYQWLPTK